MRKCLILTAATAIAAHALATNVWYVSESASAGGNGTDAFPFNTIQTAIEAASEDDIVRVMPGVYASGAHSDGYMQSRVVIDKRLTLEATGSKEETVIVGEKDPSGYGSGSVRCIYAGAHGATIRGFTITGGGVLSTDDSPAGSGGGVCGSGGEKASVWVVDCVISNCCAVRGGAVRAATVFRSLLTANYRTGLGNGAVGRDAAFYNCVITGNLPGNQPMLHNCNIVNCTVFGNATGPLWSGAYVRNSIFFKNVGTTAGLKDVHNVVLDAFDTDLSEAESTSGVSIESDPQVISPAFGDLRTIAGRTAATGGDAALMRIYGATAPEEYLHTDFLGNEIPQAGTICAGAVQAIAPAPACGGIALNGPFRIFGAPTQSSGLWAYPDAYPTQMHITRESFADPSAHVFGYWIDSSTAANMRPPEMDDSFYVLPSPTPGELMNVGLIVATTESVRYVNPASGNDDANNGESSESPFKTLQNAADSIGENVYAVVYCEEGSYDGETQNTTSAGGNARRLAVTSSTKHIRFKGAGRGRSVIVGAADAETGVCGTGTCGGVYLNSLCILQGFTVKDCYGNSSGGDLGYGGAGIAATSLSNALVADCDFRSCTGNKGGAAYYGAYARCGFFSCTGLVSCVRAPRWLTSCLFVGNHEGGQGVLADLTGTVWGSTIVGDGTRSYGGNTALTNCILASHMESSSGGKLGGCVVYNTGYFVTKTGFTRADPLFVSNSDPRVKSGTPAASAGVVLDANASLFMCTGDYLGRALSFNSAGVPVAGCYQWPVSVYAIEEPAYGSVEPTGTVVLNAGESLSLKYTPDQERPRQQTGFQVGEEFIPSVSGVSVYCAPAIGELAVSSAVTVAFETNWYVNAAMDDDSGDGFTANTAKKTLAAMMTQCAVISGDTVHVAPGTYDKGEMAVPGSESFTTSNRVCIASGVTLVADKGPTATFIVGGESPTPYNNDGYKRGPAAVRCVHMKTGARLKGFTITGGHTDNSQTGDNLYSSGGGIFCVNASEESASAIIENCTITQNYGYRGGGSYAGKYVNCRFSGNVSQGAQGEDCRIAYLYGCTFGASAGNRNIMAPYCMVNCTLGPNTCQYGGAKTFKGCLFLAVTAKENIVSANSILEDCAFVTGGTLQALVEAGSVTTTRCLTAANAAGFGLDANYVPQKGSILIDAGPADADSSSFGGVDNRLSQRIYNGRIDIGANEYNWLSDYTTRFGSRRIAVESASENVKDTTTALRLTDGCSLDVGWSPISGKTTFVGVSISGGGVLSAFLDGECVATASAGDASLRFVAGENLAQKLTFAYEGSGHADISGISQKVGTCLQLF